MAPSRMGNKARVLASGRVGEVVVEDLDDPDMTYKVKFLDNKQPEQDWFAENKVGDADGAADDAKSSGSGTPRSNSKIALGRRRSESFNTLVAECTLESLQGEWINKHFDMPVVVEGTRITLNEKLLENHELVINEKGMVESFCQVDAKSSGYNGGAPLVRRQTIGEDWSFPDPSASSKNEVCKWTLYGNRDGCLVWKDGSRECVWRRKPPPVTLETLQGKWVNSMGAKIDVSGTEVSLNGMPMKMHPITFREDGTTVRSVGNLWQCRGWIEEGKMEFKEAPNEEVMQYARSVIWTRAEGERMKQWEEQMRGLGYVGSSRDVMSRGIEGCAPGTCDAKAKVSNTGTAMDLEEVKMLNDLIHQFMEPDMVVVPCRKVIPDFTNRGQTGLSLEHVHFLATNMTEEGFTPRTDDGSKGHDLPVLVRETPGSEMALKAIANWKLRLSEDKGFAPWFLDENAEFYTSLGNGHFYQALNLIRHGGESIYKKGTMFGIGEDKQLRQAVETGVSSLVLKGFTPLKVRAQIAELLNSKREYRWTTNEAGAVEIGTMAEITDRCSQFEALSKVLDAQELNCLVRNHLGVKDSDRIGM